MDISIYLKSTGQIISTRNINSSDEISHLDTSTYGYVEGKYQILKKKWNGTKVVDYDDYITGQNTAEVRQKRNILLKDSDWTQMPDSPLTDSKKTEWATYRQQLRDMMASYTDSKENTVESTTFPTEPT
tara:strand:- start:11 stop:397 length:387 start_codon:yes stop_codon:yes gene_type:complete